MAAFEATDRLLQLEKDLDLSCSLGTHATSQDHHLFDFLLAAARRETTPYEPSVIINSKDGKTLATPCSTRRALPTTLHVFAPVTCARPDILYLLLTPDSSLLRKLFTRTRQTCPYRCA